MTSMVEYAQAEELLLTLRREASEAEDEGRRESARELRWMVEELETAMGFADQFQGQVELNADLTLERESR